MAEFWSILDINGNETGRLHERGKPMFKGEYHLTVNVWIENDKGEFLISKRSSNKQFPNLWESTGGNAVAFDDSLTTAIKEVKEELGITLEAKNGKKIKNHLRLCTACKHCLADIWLFRQNVDITTVILSSETSDVKWASRTEIKRMIAEKTFATWGLFEDIDELFELT
ncbi:MAG: NUDIX domain-containing protein [Erysipelotrichales bacterium]|nr:NUDIX domain-containing protein [Erysipelotrichales bacterium]